jgi:ElaB/YqjD/DUF883 family membrane-anchored ribosome-binding protein
MSQEGSAAPDNASGPTGLTADTGAEIHRQTEGSVIADKASELADAARDKADEVGQQAGWQLRQQVGQRSDRAGEQASAISRALKEASTSLREQREDFPARVTDEAAQRLDSIGSYLRSSDPNKILADVEDFARRNPWGVAAGAAVLGLMASRFLKASSARRYDGSVTDLRYYERRRGVYEPRPRVAETHSAYEAAHEARSHEGGRPWST